MMRVLQIHTTDARGGASALAYQLHDAVRRAHDIDSRLVVGTKHRDDDTVEELGRLPGERYLTGFVERLLSLDGFGSPSSLRLQRRVRQFDPDLIHLHNVHGRYCNLLNVPLLPSDIPILWTFHDMWPFTGNCVNSFGCRRYQSCCGQCPELDNPPRLAVDTTPLLLALKRRLLVSDRLSIAVPSRWMGEMVAGSYMGDRPLTHVANGIDTTRFQPHRTGRARDAFGIDDDAFVLLFSASRLSDPRKGIRDLLTAVDSIEGTESPTLLAVGDGSVPRDSVPDGLELFEPGFLPRDRMPLAYSAADVTVIPSHGESFCLTATESMACRTPVVGYDVGGLGEQLTDEVGWPQSLGDVAGLSEAIEAAVTDPSMVERKGRAARTRVEDRYTIERMVTEYVSLYEATVARGM